MYFFRAGLLERPRRAHYRITQRGKDILEANAERIDLGVLSQFEEFREFRQSNGSVADASQSKATPVVESATAEERMAAGEDELRAALAAEVLDRVKEGDWERFEQQVLDVLKAMGYGGPRGSVERLGGHGSDQGVDGVIREDKLGLEEIYV
jgi:restriction system protein